MNLQDKKGVGSQENDTPLKVYAFNSHTAHGPWILIVVAKNLERALELVKDSLWDGYTVSEINTLEEGIQFDGGVDEGRGSTGKGQEASKLI